jgi:hypothetical protein
LLRLPDGYFPENLAVRADGSILITAVLEKELWHVAAPVGDTEANPILVHRFEHPITGIVEVAPDLFIVCLTEGYTTHESHLARIDLKGWAPGSPISPEVIFTFDDRVRALNGACLLADGVILVADCFAGLVWRVDVADDARGASARVWLKHDTMADDPDSGVAPPPQPGVNGVRYAPQTGYVYYTSTAQQVFMRVKSTASRWPLPATPEFVAAIDNADDFCLDEEAGFAYVTRHRANTVDRVPLEPRHGSEVRHIAGEPFDSMLVGPSSAAWGPAPEDRGRLAYITLDGGTTASPDGQRRPAALLRMQLRPAEPASVTDPTLAGAA